MRKMEHFADLVLMPYNYILDPKIRNSYNIRLEKNILIFDEAHNLNNIAEESMSMSMSTATIGLCIKELKFVLEEMTNEEEEVRTDAVSFFVWLFSPVFRRKMLYRCTFWKSK
jgi:regulator of telomere elongation helicase 1